LESDIRDQLKPDGSIAMLTDVFSNRYASIVLFDVFEERHRRLIVQCFKLLEGEVRPFYIGGKVDPQGESFWRNLQDRMATELGLKSLSPLAYSYQTMHLGASHTQTGVWTMNKVCENWMLSPLADQKSVDTHVKDRLSLIEIGFRIQSEEITRISSEPDNKLRAIMPSGPKEQFGTKAWYQAIKYERFEKFNKQVDELNSRFRQASCGLHYHNGFIQLAKDHLLTSKIEEPFWSLLADPLWKNVDIHMKHAFDKRDNGDLDPALYAAHALESTIKIISNEKGWTTGKEIGAHNFIDQLAAKKNQYITSWEAETLKLFFSKLRNPLGHGPGSEPMPSLSNQATDWAIESCMSWIKSLVRRM
jgi:AbiJ N-terminal domain 4